MKTEETIALFLTEDGDEENGEAVVIHTKNIVRDDELRYHVEDERIYRAVRNCKVVRNLTWNELTEAERETAYYHGFY